MTEQNFGTMPPSLNARLRSFATFIGVSWDEVVLAVSQHPVELEPGRLGKGEEPLSIGTVINLRRGMPGTREAEDDKGWIVAGYLKRSDGRFRGYDLRKGPWQLQTSTVSIHEAFDVVGRFEVTL